jgi:16S rRNA (guanine966-N2)-methyltransferase
MGLPVRPTTDFAREGLFNILNNRIGFEGMEVLDLFSGAGMISLEFSSRGARVDAVDKNVRCISFLKKAAGELDLHINTIKADVFRFLKTHSGKYDLIFADPPYDLANIEEIHAQIFAKDLLRPGGTLIIEHGAGTKLESLKQFTEHRKYGNVNFSFFVKEED